jgi:hypothetical protein
MIALANGIGVTISRYGPDRGENSERRSIFTDKSEDPLHVILYFKGQNSSYCGSRKSEEVEAWSDSPYIFGVSLDLYSLHF